MAFARSSIKDFNQTKTQESSSNFAATIVPRIAEPQGSFYDAAKDNELETSVIGTDLTILGEKITIISQNRLQIDGDIHGDVTGKQVTIGAQGSVTGTISAERIEVLGGVRGAIRARLVTLHPTSQVDGEIVHETLSISEGAHFDGRVRRSRDANELTPKLDPQAYPTNGNPGTRIES